VSEDGSPEALLKKKQKEVMTFTLDDVRKAIAEALVPISREIAILLAEVKAVTEQKAAEVQKLTQTVTELEQENESLQRRLWKNSAVVSGTCILQYTNTKTRYSSS